MTDSEILSRVDHTLLRADSSKPEIDRLCEESVEYKTASVCVPPAYVKHIRDKYGKRLTVCTVIGFPLGYSVRNAKEAELETALRDGAAEFDMVVNICDVKNGKFVRVVKEIKALKKLAGKKVLKVIVETCYLTRDEKVKLCESVTEAGADYIKTSTGFGPAGAVISDITLFREHIGRGVKIKAAGGIKTREDMVSFIEAGCDRIGSSSAVKILGGETADGY